MPAWPPSLRSGDLLSRSPSSRRRPCRRRWDTRRAARPTATSRRACRHAVRRRASAAPAAASGSRRTTGPCSAAATTSAPASALQIGLLVARGKLERLIVDPFVPWRSGSAGRWTRRSPSPRRISSSTSPAGRPGTGSRRSSAPGAGSPSRQTRRRTPAASSWAASSTSPRTPASASSSPTAPPARRSPRHLLEAQLSRQLHPAPDGGARARRRSSRRQREPVGHLLLAPGGSWASPSLPSACRSRSPARSASAPRTGSTAPTGARRGTAKRSAR